MYIYTYTVNRQVEQADVLLVLALSLALARSLELNQWHISYRIKGTAHSVTLDGIKSRLFTRDRSLDIENLVPRAVAI
jgi:hypothetical protein